MDKQRLARGGGLYPDILCTRLGENAPATLTAIGLLAHLAQRKTALICSARSPGHIILATYDQAARWRDDGRCVISGFHSPVERECLRILLRGRQPVIICLARGLDGMRRPAEWKQPLTDNRLLVLSQFPASERRATKSLAKDRNQLVAALADEVVFAHITPGGHLDELRLLVASWRVPQRVLAAGERPSP